MEHGDHGGHGDHGDHGDMPGMVMKCSMNMIWNTQIADTCIVFEQWHISTTFGFIVSCFVIIAIGVFYEYLRLLSTQVDVRIANDIKRKRGPERSETPILSAQDEEGVLSTADESAALLNGRVFARSNLVSKVPTGARTARAVLYGLTVFLSFFLMLVFMTYNAYLILSVVLGAAIGHYIFNERMNVDSVLSGQVGGKGMSCH